MKSIDRILFWLISISVPVNVILFAVGILLTPLYIQIEYRLPGFPADPYGFTTEERLFWANITRKYLVETKDIQYLADQELEDNIPLYNDRELRHLYDVKAVVKSASVVFLVVAFFFLIMGYWSRRTSRFHLFTSAISWGGWLTVGLLIAILVYLGLNFNSLFVNFHKVFFEGDSWLFKYSDTLIRLFPIRFWRDAFIWIGVMSLVAGYCIGHFVKHKLTRIG